MSNSILSWLVSSLTLLGGAPEGHSTVEIKPAPYGYLWFYESDGNGGLRKRVERYEPREGDILFYDSLNWLWARFYNIAGSGPPLHAGIMVKNSAGVYHVLEAGPDDHIWVYLLEASHRVHQFRGVLQVRRCKKIFTPEESAQVTGFSEAQVGKGLATLRLVSQMTPFKIRGGYKEQLFGKTWMNRHRWLCIELVVTVGTMVGMFDSSIKGNVVYPLDLLNDTHRYDISASHEPAGYWCAHP